MSYRSVSVRPTDRWLVGTGTRPNPALHTLHNLLDTANGNTWKSTGGKWLNTGIGGGVNIHDKHVHHQPVNDFFHFHTGITKTINWDVTEGSRVLTLVDVTGLLIGDELQIHSFDNLIYEPTHPTITAIDPVLFVVTLDRPLDLPWSIGDTIEIIENNMSLLSGTLYNPVAFKTSPEGTDTWHVQSFVLTMIVASAPDDSKFGDQAALTNGIVLRGYNAELDRFHTFTNWKTNSDIKLDMLDVIYTDKAGGGSHGVTGDGAILERTGALPELNGDKGDYLEILIQDDLTTIESLRLKIQGHIEDK